MSYLGFTPQETTVSTDTVMSAVDGAIRTANQRIQAMVPAIGASPVGRLTEMVADPKFVEIIKIANGMSGKTTRIVGGVAIDMNPVSSAAVAADAKLATASLRSLALKLRILASWLVLSRYAPVTLARASVEWCRKHLNWSPSDVAAALAAIAGQAPSSAARDFLQRVYAEAIRLWHTRQPRVVGGPQNGQLVTAGPAYNIWLAAKPATPVGLTTLNGGIFERGLHGLSGSNLKQAYRALHGLGGEGEGESDPPADPGGQQSGTSGTPPPEAKGQEAAILTAIMPLLLTLLTVGIPAVAKTVTTVATGGRGQQTSYHYNPDGTSTDGGQPLPPPPVGSEYDGNGILIAGRAVSEGIPGWLMLAGALGVGWAVTRKS